MITRLYAAWLWRWLYQPRWLKRWYYRKSFQWWGHPSNNHWKQCICTGPGDGGTMPWGLWSNLKPGERDLWSGEYCSVNMKESSSY